MIPIDYGRCEIPQIYQNHCMDDYRGVGDQAMRAVEKYIERLPRMREKGHGLYFYGPNGIGKTGLMCEVMKKACDKGYPALFETLAGLVDKVIAGWNSPEAVEDLARARGTCFLGIDDIGKEYKGKSDYVITVFDRILRYRIMWGHPTLLTSNIDPEQMVKRYGDSIGSLLRGHFLPLKLAGNDFRKILQSKLQDDILGGEIR